MFRPMRREKQQIKNEEAIKILNNAATGILAVNGDDGYPYAVPVNYVLLNDKIYIHCATSGHKKDAVEKNEKVSFCVIAKDKVVPAKFATDYASVIVFAVAKFVTDNEIRLQALRALNKKYAPQYQIEGEAEIKKAWKAVAILELTPKHITGKEASPAIQEAARNI